MASGIELERRSTPRKTRKYGRYELVSKLGTGGMAEVWLARVRAEAGFERLFAIKLALPELQDDPNAAAMFFDEARLAARIHHPNVVATVDVGREGDRLWLAMEYVHGVRLVDLIRSARVRSRDIPVPIILRIVVDALRGLHAAHQVAENGRNLGIVHRDVSPHNIMVGYDGVTRLLDFGIAKADTRNAVTQRGQIKGKFGYMAPEQLVGGVLTQQADIYGAGVVLWETLSRRRLIGTGSNEHSTKDLLDGRVRPPSTYRDDVSAQLDAAVTSALAVDAQARHQSASSFADALEACGEPLATQSELAAFVERWLPASENDQSATAHALSSASSSSSTTNSPGRSRTRNAWIAAAAVLVLLTMGWAAVSAFGPASRVERSPSVDSTSITAPSEPIRDPLPALEVAQADASVDAKGVATTDAAEPASPEASVQAHRRAAKARRNAISRRRRAKQRRSASTIYQPQAP